MKQWPGPVAPARTAWRAAADSLRTSWPEWMAVCAGLAVVVFFVFSLPPANPGGSPPPEAADQPFRTLHWQLEMLVAHVPALLRIWPAVALLAAAVLLASLWRRDRPRGLRAAGLVAAAAAAVEAQLFIADGKTGVGASLYGAAFLLMLVWAVAFSRRDDPPDAPAPGWPAELLWLLAVLALAVFFRTYRLGSYPYGYEGDELKYTMLSALVTVDGRHEEYSEWNLGQAPLNTYMQLPFHRILGPSMFSARAAQAFWNLLGVASFFWLMRQLFRPPAALLATLFLAVSVPDASSARHGALENFVALWASLALALLALGLRKRRAGFFALSGLAACLGLLTLDTFIPAAGTLLVIFGWELFQMKDEPVVARARFAVALAIPFALTSVAVATNFLARFGYYGVRNQKWTSETFRTLARNASDAASLLFQKLPLTDFSYNRNGPIENSLILPLLVLGLAYALANVRRSRVAWGALWFLFGFFPIPILIHFPLTRVVYPNLPALYFLAGIGAWVLFCEVAACGPVWRVISFGALVVCLVFYVGANAFLIFNRVLDYPDRIARRELYDALAREAGARAVVYLPTMPNGQDLINIEAKYTVRFGARAAGWRDKVPGGLAAYKVLPFGELLPELSRPDPSRDRAVVVFDKQAVGRVEDRSSVQLSTTVKVTAAMERCFPKARKTFSGAAFDVWNLSADALSARQCSAGRLTLEPPSASAAPRVATLGWKLEGASATRLMLSCEKGRPDVLFVEAETFKGDGWEVAHGHAPDALGASYLIDTWGKQGTPLTVALPPVPGGPVYAWVRTWKRVKDTSPAFLSAAGLKQEFFNYSENRFSTWVWERLGPYKVPADRPSEWTVHRPYNDDTRNFSAILLDTIVLTTDATFDPSADDGWRPDQSQAIDLPSPLPSKGSLRYAVRAPGRYRCRLKAVAGEGSVDAWGNSFLDSNTAEWQAK